ncbi:hypothetical protein [Nitrososphaera viennensis]|uniref:Uncharacterized protein n=2 Tax=Nitrososphaera viennensis TaxID=1034015 RepID=A0A060HHF8_9ARCH|nr:hypothetical protein [Nitrososphaera viennensis]AIC14785.1 hypothetical protein NVIE_005830 [Nitrososphaera viennensis EN76]UVS69740.1 hypothetical protein NWT39_02885 [Nitrososphaera viennensis]
MDTSKGVFINETNRELSDHIRKALAKDGVKEKDIHDYDPAKIQKDSLVAILHEKTVSSTKVSLLRVSEVAEDGRPNLVPEKVIEGKI